MHMAASRFARHSRHPRSHNQCECLDAVCTLDDDSCASHRPRSDSVASARALHMPHCGFGLPHALTDGLHGHIRRVSECEPAHEKYCSLPLIRHLPAVECIYLYV